MSQTQADVELNPEVEVFDDFVDEAGPGWMRWLLIPLALVAVAGIVFFVVRRFFGNAGQ